VSSVSKWRMVLAILGALTGFLNLPRNPKSIPRLQKRPVTVADAIGMTRVAGTPYPYFSPQTGFAVFSPNGKHFAIAICRGDIRHNSSDYSLLVFRTHSIASGAIPKPLVTFASASNRAGISQVTWRDSSTILFLGSRGNGPTELYSVRYPGGQLQRLTDYRQSLVSYGFSRDGNALVYAAERPEYPVINPQTLRYGLDVGSQRVSDIIRGLIANREPQLFLKKCCTAKDTPLRTEDPFDSGVNDLFVSPNGRYLVVKTDVTDVPGSWRKYDDEGIQSVFRRMPPKGQPSRILHYELIDLRTGKSSVLLDSPTTYSTSDVLWAPDSKSLLLCGTYLPLDVNDPAELEQRRAKRFVVEVKVKERSITKITEEDLQPLRWDTRTGVVWFHVRPGSPRPGVPPEVVCYRETGGRWERVTPPDSFTSGERPEIYVNEDLNVPPRMMVLDPRTKRKTVLTDLNPQFRALELGKERLIHWMTPEGGSLTGGLYYPPNYIPGKRYPLVIQTHAFNPHDFWIDGPYSTAFAAQPLASQGIVVLQMNDIFFDTIETPEEPKQAENAYLSAINYLNAQGIIDPARVGIIGFSRTCMYVKYALTHASRHFAAAVIADGVDAGYFQYLLSYNANPLLASDSEAIIGGPPFGRGLLLWIKNSPGFLMERVQAPVLIQAIGPISILDEWQWFAGLKRLGKPVDMMYLPTGTHVLVKPWDRLASQQGTVDWFCFWLKRQVDKDPRKADQYRRWRELRLEAQANAAFDANLH
jgi:dipeptidyl aminopeptidase/acylaminoacyl peptidase